MYYDSDLALFRVFVWTYFYPKITDFSGAVLQRKAQATPPNEYLPDT